MMMMMEFQVHSPEFLTIFGNSMEDEDAENEKMVENRNEQGSVKTKRQRQTNSKMDSRSLADENGNQLPDLETQRRIDGLAMVKSDCVEEDAAPAPAGHEKTGPGGARRNERERNRVRQVNLGFDRLRQHVPQGRKNKKLSKVDTLKAAVDYIKHLQTVLTEADCLLGTNPCSGYFSVDHLPAEAMHIGVDVTSSAQIDDVFTQLDDLRAAHALFQLGDFDHLLSACAAAPTTTTTGAVSISGNSNIGNMPSITELLMQEVVASSPSSHSVDTAAVSPGAFSSSSSSSSSSSLSSSVYGGAYTNELKDSLNTNGHLAFSFSTWYH